jgi:hypothetical protein
MTDGSATVSAGSSTPTDPPTATPAAQPAPAREPAARKPDARKPDTTKPDARKPDAGTPAARKPSAGKSAAGSSSPRGGAGSKAGSGASKPGKGASEPRKGSSEPAGAATGVAAGGARGTRAGAAVEVGPRARPVAWTPQLLAVSVAWLAVLLYGTRVSIGSAGQPEEAVDWTTLALPGVVSASLVAGASLGAFAVDRLLRRRPEPATWLRWLVGVGGGVLVGLVVGVLVLVGYGHASAILVLAGAVLSAGALGGVLAGLPAREVVVGGVAATLTVILVEFVIQVFQSPLRHLFGGGDSGVSQWNAGTRLAVTQALVGGAAAGVVAFWYLRRAGRGARLGSYLAAGALPGIALLLGEAVTRIGGRQVFAAVAGLSEGDRVLLDYWKNSRLNQALVVLFVGAIVALVCFGRTLPKRRR